MKNVFLKVGIAITTIAIILVSFFLIKAKTYKVVNPVATIQIEGYDKPIKVELDAASAPNAVANFVKLANSGFYNDYIMTIDEDKVVSDGSKDLAKMSNLMESPSEDYEYSIIADLPINNIENLNRHNKGVITMVNYYDKMFGVDSNQNNAFAEILNTANNEFALLSQDANKYNGIFVPFGKIIEGQDVLDAISATRVEKAADDSADTDNTADAEITENTNNDTENTEENAEEVDMTNKIKIKSITVDTFGVDYGVPETVKFQDNLMQVYSRLYSVN